MRVIIIAVEKLYTFIKRNKTLPYIHWRGYPEPNWQCSLRHHLHKTAETTT